MLVFGLLLCILLFLLPSVYPQSLSFTACDQLFCERQNRVCAFYQDTGVQCVDACKDDFKIPVGAPLSCTIENRFCDVAGTTRFRCDTCGCPQGNFCDVDNICKRICSDGTKTAQCADTRPQYCQDGRLVDNSQICGCEEGKFSQTDGSCGDGGIIRESSIEDFQKGVLDRLVPHQSINLAPLGTAFASSSYAAPSTWTYRPTADKITDGIFYTDWVSEVGLSANEGQYVGIEWSNPKEFDEVVFTQSTFTAKSYKIQVERDGTWIDVVKSKRLPYYPEDFSELNFNYYNGFEKRVSEIVSFSPVTSKKVRIFFNDCYSVCRIFEFEVYNTKNSTINLNDTQTNGVYISDILDTKTTNRNISYQELGFSYNVEVDTSKDVNIGPQGTAIAASVYNGLSFVSIASVNDGSRFGNYWAPSQSQKDDWVGIQWNEPRTINKINLALQQPQITCFGHFVVEYLDGSEWKLAKRSQKGSPSDFGLPCNESGYHKIGNYLVTEKFDAVTTSKVRIRPVPYWLDWAYVSEIEVFEDISAIENLAPQGTAVVSSSLTAQNIAPGNINDGSITSFVALAEQNIASQGTVSVGGCDGWCTSTNWICQSSINDGITNPNFNGCSAFSDPHLSHRNFYISFPAGHTFTRAVIYGPRYRLQSYSIKYLENGVWNSRLMPDQDYVNGVDPIVAILDPPITTTAIGYTENSMSPNAIYAPNYVEFQTFTSQTLPKVWKPVSTDAQPTAYIQFSVQKEFDKVAFVEETDIIQNYQVMYWQNGQWNYINAPQMNPTGSVQNKLTSFTLPAAILTDRIGIKILSTLNSNAPSLRELYTYGKPSPVPHDLTGSRVKLQIRTASINQGEIGQWTPWTGPDGTSSSYFTQSRQGIPSMHNGNKFIQYKAWLETADPKLITGLNEVNISFSGKLNIEPVVTTKDHEIVFGQPVNFNSIANDIGGYIAKYEWDFGDGVRAQGQSPSHTYAEPGSYNARVTVTDNDGAKSTAISKVFVNIYDCLTSSAIGNGPDSSLFSLDRPIVSQKAIDAINEYANKKGIGVNDVDTVTEYYEAANNYITAHMSYSDDNVARPRTGWDGASAERLFRSSGTRGCANDYCGDCEDYAITTASLLRAFGVNNKCVYVACSRIHCWDIINVNSKFRILEPQVGSLRSQFNSKAYDFVSQGYVAYAVDNVFNDYVGRYFEVDNARPADYTLNYPGRNGMPDSANKCPQYTTWPGQGDKTYFEDICS